MKKILGIGNALVDVMTVLDDDKVLENFGLPKGSMQLVDGAKSAAIKTGTANCKRNMVSGGSAANTIHGLAMMGTETGFIGSVGRDFNGDFFDNDMKKAGVETILSRRDNVTGTSVAMISVDSERTMATHLGAAVELEASDLNKDDFKRFDILYLEGYLIINWELFATACTYARENNMKIAIDMASYNVVEANLERFNEVIDKYADIVFANEEEAKALTGMGPEQALDIIAGRCEIAVVKIGKDGSLIKRGDEKVRIGTLKVNSVDTTGAGDIYAGGFLHGYASDLSLEKCGIIGSVLAGNVIEKVGARIEDSRWPKVIGQVNAELNNL